MEKINFVCIDDYLIEKMEKTKLKNGEKKDRMVYEDFLEQKYEEFRENF